jgi:DNA polymerase/3'-5' exonuclease PolX
MEKIYYYYINMDNIIKFLKGIRKVYIVGSVARNEKKNNDVDVITTLNINILIFKINQQYDLKIIKYGTKYSQIRINNIEIDIWKAKIDNYKQMRILRTIDKYHYIAYKKIAKKQDMKLNDTGLYKNDERIQFNSEKQLRKLLYIE